MKKKVGIDQERDHASLVHKLEEAYDLLSPDPRRACWMLMSLDDIVYIQTCIINKEG